MLYGVPRHQPNLNISSQIDIFEPSLLADDWSEADDSRIDISNINAQPEEVVTPIPAINVTYNLLPPEIRVHAGQPGIPGNNAQNVYQNAGNLQRGANREERILIDGVAPHLAIAHPNSDPLPIREGTPRRYVRGTHHRQSLVMTIPADVREGRPHTIMIPIEIG